jgi:hypothetical protein
MTQSETREFIFKLTKTLIAKQCYIKGYGEQFRVMDGQHNPEMNINKRQFKILQHNGLVEKDGLIYRVTKTVSPFVAAIDVKLPMTGID